MMTRHYMKTLIILCLLEHQNSKIKMFYVGKAIKT